MASALTVPVVLLTFNRPQHTAQVLARVRQVRPVTLLVVGDGPRPDRPADAALVAATRALFEHIDWPCSVQTNFAERNLGLADRVASGIAWAFAQVEQAIILEDDCVPDVSFFGYCAELLARYADDARIMVVSGNNFQDRPPRNGADYYFSRYNHCWGWATWRRAWAHYDHAMRLWPQVRDGGWLVDLLDGDRRAARDWRKRFDDVYRGRVNSWATRWTLACWLQSGLTALPCHNLVTNVGFGRQASNTRWGQARLSRPSRPIALPLRSPQWVVRDAAADAITQRRIFRQPLWRRAWQKLALSLRQFTPTG